MSSKMHELAPGINLADPHFASGRGYSSLAAYNRSKLAQVPELAPCLRLMPPCSFGSILQPAPSGESVKEHLERVSMLRMQVLFTAELRRRLPPDCGVVAVAVHPGEVMTDVVRSLPGPMQSAYRFFMRPFCLSPPEGSISQFCQHLDARMHGSESMHLLA